MIKKKIFPAKNAPQARFFYKTKCAAGKIYETKCAAGQIFGLNPDRYLVYRIDIICNLFFTSHSSESYSFN